MAEKMAKAAKKESGINVRVLESLISKCESIKGEMDETRGELGAAIKNAEEAHGVHRKAFKLMLALKRMDAAARSDFLRAFDDYRGKLGFDAQGDMFEDGPAAAVDAGAVQGAENAERIAKGVKKLEPAVR